MPISSEGRMIRKDLRKSKGFAALSKEAQVLFCMLIPHFNPHGKVNGDPHFIKGQVCPLIEYLTVQRIEKCLAEIHQKTAVKWYEFEGIKYLHSLNWKEHQKLRENRLGEDHIPDYISSLAITPGVVPATPGVRPHEDRRYKNKVKGRRLKVKEEVAGKQKALARFPGALPVGFQELEKFETHIKSTYQTLKRVQIPIGKKEKRIMRGCLANYSLPQALALWDLFLAKDWNWEDKKTAKMVHVPHDLVNFQGKWTLIAEDHTFHARVAEHEAKLPKNQANIAKLEDILKKSIKAI